MRHPYFPLLPDIKSGHVSEGQGEVISFNILNNSNVR